MTILARATVLLGADISHLNRELSKAEQNVVNAGKRLSDIGSKMTTRVTLPLAAAAVVAFKEFGEQAEAMARVRAQIQATGGVAGVTADHIERLGNTLEDVTTFADDVTQSAAGLLLMFTNVKNTAGEGNDIFDQTVKIAQDMAATFGDDLQSTMLLVGRAMEDPAEGLMMLDRRTRAFDERTEKLIKRLMEEGRVLEAQQIILDRLNARVKNNAAEMAKTPFGQLKQAWNELGNAMEQVGEILAEVLLPFIRMIRDLAREFQALDKSVKTSIVIFVTAVAAIGPLLVLIGSLIAILPIMATLFAGLAIPIGAAVLAIAAIVNTGRLVIEHWDYLKQQAVLLAAFVVDTFFKMTIGLLKLVRDVDLKLSGFFARLATATADVAPLVSLAASAASEALGREVDNVNQEIRTLERMQEQALGKLGGVLAGMEAEQDARLQREADERRRREQDAKGGVPPTPPDTTVSGKLADITEEMQRSLAVAARMEQAFGETFDFAAERAKILEKAIADAAAVKGLSMDHPTVQAWIAALQGIEENAFNLEMKHRRLIEAIEKAKNPLVAFNAAVAALQEDLVTGAITWDVYIQKMEAAKAAFDGVTDKAKTTGEAINQGIGNIASGAVDSFVDTMFDAGQSFGDIIKQMLIDIAKLILKLELMKLLFPDASSDGLGSLFGLQHGGFLKSGDMAVVGEAGPELVSAGRGGVTVQPMHASSVPSSGGSGGITVPVSVNVAAMDSRDVGRFFQENEAVVATAVTKAVSRSVALRRMLQK